MPISLDVEDFHDLTCQEICDWAFAANDVTACDVVWLQEDTDPHYADDTSTPDDVATVTCAHTIYVTCE
jgi:hypothetical protein